MGFWLRLSFAVYFFNVFSLCRFQFSALYFKEGKGANARDKDEDRLMGLRVLSGRHKSARPAIAD